MKHDHLRNKGKNSAIPQFNAQEHTHLRKPLITCLRVTITNLTPDLHSNPTSEGKKYTKEYNDMPDVLTRIKQQKCKEEYKNSHFSEVRITTILKTLGFITNMDES
jgi:hypothetical protein